MNRDDLLQLHDETCSKTRAIMVAKNNDYSGGTRAPDALANFKCSHTLDLHPVTGLLLRMQDKMMRVKSFVADGALKVSGETVEDAFDDMVNYAILGKALLREERQLQEVRQLQEACVASLPAEPFLGARPTFNPLTYGGKLTIARLPAEALDPQPDNDECSCGRRLIMHYSRGWGCEDCDF